MAMELDPLLAPLFANWSFPAHDDIGQERAQELAAARSAVGALVRPVPEFVAFRDEDFSVPDVPAPVTVRVYEPGGTTPKAGLLFIHGGGWSTGSIETAHEHCGNLAADAGVVVVSVGYRLAPEHPYPAGLDDCYAALQWTAANAPKLGIDPRRLAVGGGSAGGNLAAAIALRARDDGGPGIALQLLEVPVLDLSFGSPSVAEVTKAFPQLGGIGERTLSRYLTAGADVRDPYVSPLLAPDVGGLPPAVLLACEIDPVRDDCARYAERLRAVGVPARSEVFPGLVHGTNELTGALPAAARWHEVCVQALREI